MGLRGDLDFWMFGVLLALDLGMIQCSVRHFKYRVELKLRGDKANSAGYERFGLDRRAKKSGLGTDFTVNV